ncbi:MAG: hypothetical protein ABIO91_06075 [Pyrinomonadaceae bacterium]
MIETSMVRTQCMAPGGFYTLSVVLFLLACLPAFGQGGNSVSGSVFGVDRRPLADMHVELLDDLNRTIGRSRTNSSGRYVFYGLSSGRFSVRVMPLGTNYEEQEQAVEIVNFSRSGGVGATRSLGNANEIKDFYLALRRGASGLAAPSTVFAQEVPDKAKDLYKAAVDDIAKKRTKEGYDSLKASIEVFPKYFLALETLGIEYVKARYYVAAQVLLTSAVQINPRAYKSWHGLAISLQAQKKNEQALAAVEKAIEVNGLAPESLFLAGSLLRQAKNYPAAEKNLSKAKELFGGSAPDVYWELALLYAHGMKRYKDAARELKLYLKAMPDGKNVESVKKLIAEFEAKAKTT